MWFFNGPWSSDSGPLLFVRLYQVDSRTARLLTTPTLFLDSRASARYAPSRSLSAIR